MNDLVRFATSVEYTTGKKRGRHPVFNSNMFYPYKEERRLQQATKNEIESFLGAAFVAAVAGGSFVSDSLDDLSNLPEELSEDMKREISYAADSIARKASQNIVNMTEMVVGKPYFPPSAKQEILDNWQSSFAMLCKSAKSDVKKDISMLVQQARNEGWNLKQLEREVKDRLPSKYAGRAQNIARTETAKLETSVTLSTYREIGVEYYVWMSAMDERTRPEHAMMNGLICSVNDPTVWYEENPDDPMHPILHKRDDTMVHLHPGEDFQCRCVMVPWDPMIDGKYEVKERPEEGKPEEKPENESEGRELEKANERLAEKEKELEKAENERKTVEKELAQEKVARKAAEKAVKEFSEKNEETSQILERGGLEDKIKIVKKDRVLKSLMNSTPQQVEKIAEAIRVDGILNAGVLTEKVSSTQAVERICDRIRKKNTGIIGEKLSVVEFSESPNGNFFTGMKSEHVARKIYLNSNIPLYFDTENLSPKELLFAAFEDLRHGRKLSFAREYAIESFYHELLHLNAKGWVALPENSTKRLAMEIMNQFVSRHYYHELIGAIGGEAVNQTSIKKYGTGYKKYLDDFNNLLDKKKIEAGKVAKWFREVLLNERYDSLESYLDKFMEDNFKIGFLEFIGTSQSK